jgi:hypothetical protein
MTYNASRRLTLLGVGLALTAGILGVQAPAEAAPRSYAPSWGYGRYNDFDRYRYNRYDHNRYGWGHRSPYSRWQDSDRDGIRNEHDRDVDNDGIRNSRDRDMDGDGVRNSRDRFDKKVLRR